MKILKVTTTENNHIRFLFYDGSTHSISTKEWRAGMKEIYYNHHKVLLIRKEMPLSDKIVFSQAL